MKRKLLGIAVMAVVAVVATFGYLQNKKANILTMDPALANVEALATGERIQGSICNFKGSEIFGNMVYCTADFPDFGPCGERIEGWFSDNQAQCNPN